MGVRGGGRSPGGGLPGSGLLSSSSSTSGSSASSSSSKQTSPSSREESPFDGRRVARHFGEHGAFSGSVQWTWIASRDRRPRYRVKYTDGAWTGFP